MIGGYPALQPTAGSMDFTWVAAGAAFADGFSFPSTGKEILLVNNKNIGAQTLTVNSVADKFGRTGDITAYSMAAADFAVFEADEMAGWRRPDGDIWGAVSATDVELAVLRRA